jgi:anthranilate/para-aminobenzoate synthase component I
MTSAPTSTAGRLGAVAPTREEFRELAVGHRVIPVVRRLLADDETPIGVYRKLAGDRPGTFLLESAENGRSWSRWSFVGAHCAAALTEVDGSLTWTGDVPAGLPTAGDPLAARIRSRILGRDLPAEKAEYMDRLRSKKAEVSGELEQKRAAARFEPTPDAPVDTSVIEAEMAAPSTQPKPPEAPKKGLGAEQEEESYTSRLLKAKKKVWEDKDKL